MAFYSDLCSRGFPGVAIWPRVQSELRDGFWCFSDLKVKVGEKMYSAHKFVLAARSDVWSLSNMMAVTELDLSGEVGEPRAMGFAGESQGLSLHGKMHSVTYVSLPPPHADTKPSVAMAMLRWAYTDELELSEDDTFLIDLMKLANRFQLQLLRERYRP